jgi:hypothetical protein
LTLRAAGRTLAGVRVVATPEAVAFVRERGGRVFVWTLEMDAATGGATVFALEASTESPGPERRFARLAGADFDVLLDAGDRGPPDELHLALKGWRRKRIRAYWNGRSFARDAPV